MTDCALGRNTKSNTKATLADLAKRARKQHSGHLQSWMECAKTLAEAREIATHGEWLPFLEEAGIHRRTASRMLALAPFKLDTVSYLGGVGEALRRRDELPAAEAMLAEIAQAKAEIADLNVEIETKVGMLSDDERALWDKYISQCEAISGLKREIAAAMHKLADATREVKALRRRKKELEVALA